MIEDKELNALIRLLEDPNEEVYSLVYQKLKTKGRVVIPMLEKAWENSLNQFYQNRLEELVKEIQFEDVYYTLIKWKETKQDDLLFACYLISKYKYPNLEFSELQRAINLLITDVKEIYDERFTPLEKIKAINHILFDVHRFARNDMHFYAINNSFLNKVFETKRGNSLSLAIIYMLVAQGVGLPIYGVNLPKNFILVYMDERTDNKKFKDDVLFYVNPFNRGAVLGKKEIDHFLIHQKLPSKKEFYSPCKVIDIVERLLLSLSFSFEQKQFKTDVAAMNKLINILKK